MVKSKKMSKTSIAVIVLAILLVLSLALGITGAWYTRTESGAINDSDGATFTLNDFMELSLVNDHAGDGFTYSIARTAEGVAVENLDSAHNTTLILPGDKITFTGTQSLSIDAVYKAGAENDFWYLIKYDDSYYNSNNLQTALNVSGSGLVAGHGTATNDAQTNWKVVIGNSAADAGVEYGSGQAAFGSISNGVFTVDAVNTTTDDIGHTVTISVAGHELKVAVMQYHNESATDAYTVLKGLIDDMA